MTNARFLVLCALAAVVACHKDSGSEAPPKGAPHVAAPALAKKGPSAEQQTAGMAEAPSQGKSQLAVKLKFAIEQRPALGQPVEITVAVMPQIDGNSASIQVAGGDGLTVGPEANKIDLPAVEAGQVYRQSIKVTPTAEGLLLLGLTVSLKHDEAAESRAFSIPLIVER
jgi:hypothetical protein